METLREWYIRRAIRPRRILHRRLAEYRRSLLPSVRISLRGWWAKGQVTLTRPANAPAMTPDFAAAVSELATLASNMTGHVPS